MKILRDRKATLELKEGSWTYMEFGRYLSGTILEGKFKDIAPEIEEFYNYAKACRVVEISDTYENVFDIPEDQILSIKY